MADGRILSIAQMSAADAGAIEAGVAGITLMENAGAAIAEAILARHQPLPVLVLCGPGNNGGDGFVVARRLRERGWPVRVALLGSRERLAGDAAQAAAAWPDDVIAVEAAALGPTPELVVDALFGAGLARPIEGAAAATLEAVARRGGPVVAVDVPSGVHGDSGEVLGVAAAATLTVTFHRPKPGHFLLPGRALRGELVVADIGIPDAVTDRLDVRLWANDPARWLTLLPRRTSASHKYSHGHALVVGGGRATSGAARLAARAALRAGAGAVTVLCPPDAVGVYAAHLTAVMLAPVAEDGFEDQLSDPRRTAVLLGPGGGVGAALRARVLACLRAGKACVLDADALTSFADAPADLFGELRADCLLTPHEGEFARLFPLGGDKLTRAREAAARSSGVVLLKGADTVIAAPDGRALMQTEAPPGLATAGSGDVLAGIALGLIAQGMPTLEAAGAAAWMHAAAAAAFGPGVIAEDLSEQLPTILADLQQHIEAKPLT